MECYHLNNQIIDSDIKLQREYHEDALNIITDNFETNC